MGSFLEEIIKGGLGNVFGNASGGNSGGGMEDILKDITGNRSTTTTASKRGSATEVDMSDIAKSIRKNAGASGPAPQRSTVDVDETQTKGGLDDVVKDLRRKMGMDVEEEPVKKTSTKNKRNTQVEEEETAQNGGIDLGSLGGLGGILSILLGQGLNLGNLGEIAKGILKTIGLAGGSMK